MITFYPRDISLWREDFDFSKRPDGPSRTFKNREELSEFIMSKWGMHTNDDFPLKFIEEPNHYFNTTHVVHKWTIMGWSREDN